MIPSWLIPILGAVYKKVPPPLRPPLTRAFKWTMLRLEAITTRRSIERSRRVQYLDFEIAHLEPFEFLGPGPREVLVDAVASCVSPGTERAVLMGLPGARRPFPYVPGYSMVGTVAGAGAQVQHVARGDLVAGRMPHAARGLMNGATCFKVPPGVAPDQASMIELGIITLQGIRKAGIRPGDRVAVVGMGLIGQLAARLARLVGAEPIVAVASSRRRAGPALASGGVDEFVSLSTDASRLTTIQADVVIEAVGSAAAITGAMAAARPGGTVVLLGSSRDLGRDLDWWTLAQERNLTLVGAHISDMPGADSSAGRWTYVDEGRLFLDLLASGALDLGDLITWRPAPEDCNEVYEILAEGGRDQVGIVFQWANQPAIATP
ncbi:MAG: zinc-binding alcohol dehydrogenase [Vicinamibacterales bacterium]